MVPSIKNRLLKKKVKSGKKKLKKKVVAVSTEQQVQAEPQLDEQIDRLQADPAAQPERRLELAGRGFRISFGSLPASRKLGEQHRAQMTKDIKVKNKSKLKIGKDLLPSHPALTKLSSAKNQVLNYFHTHTLPFPDPGVRLFMLETDHLNFEVLSEEEIERDFARQIDEFMTRMRQQLEGYEQARAELRAAWPEVLRLAKEDLDEVFDPRDYCTADELETKLYCHIRPYNISLPPEYSYVSPQERQKALAAIESQYRQAVEMQEQLVTQMFSESIDQMIASIQGYHDGKTRCFKNSVVETVFKAIEEFKNKTRKYGILRGTELERAFDRVTYYMQDTVDAQTTATILRESPGKRAEIMDKIGTLRSTIMSLAEERRARYLVRD